MGNDEHSQNVYKRAVEQAGCDPVAYCDRDGAGVPRRLGTSSTARSTTSSAPPSRGTAPPCRSWRSACYDAGDIYEGVYEGWYCVSCEAFKQEKDLRRRQVPDHPTLTPEWIRRRTTSSGCRNTATRCWSTSRRNPEFLAARRAPQRDPAPARGRPRGHLASAAPVSSWGIPLPFAPENVVYVWFDALINYVTAVGYGADERGRRFARLVAGGPARHRQGHHAVPHRRLAGDADERRVSPLPRQVFGHGWVNFGGQRMSKSLGTSVDPIGRRRRASAPTRCAST